MTRKWFSILKNATSGIRGEGPENISATPGRIRPLLALFLLTVALCAVPLRGQEEGQYQVPAEEDEDITQKTEYAFNPLQASKEFKIGEFYWKKKSWRAAAGRYEEAVKWNPGYAEAWWKLAQAREQLIPKQPEVERHLQIEAVREAYEKYLELESAGGKAKKAQQRLAELKKP